MRLLALDTRNSNKLRSSSNETSESGGQGTGERALDSASSDGSKNSGRSGEASVIRNKLYATSKQHGDMKSLLDPYSSAKISTFLTSYAIGLDFQLLVHNILL
jgi:hypothetical protein